MAVARDALEGWLEAHLVGSAAPPRPATAVTAPRKQLAVSVSPSLAIAMQIRFGAAKSLAGPRPILGRRSR